MKKMFFVVIAAALICSFASSELSARSLILKGGWAMMRNDLADADDTWTGGVFVDMGTFVFSSLRFRPGIDYVEVEGDNWKYADIWGIHMDWWWFPLQNAPVNPFLGFGPVLNYIDWNEDRNDDDDSDAGVDLFAGAAFGLRGTPLELFVEARYRFIDIASRDTNILAFNLGIEIKF